MGLIDFHSKAQANLILHFLQTSRSSSFGINYINKRLYDFYILGVGIKEPPRPPWLGADIFDLIKEALEERKDVFGWKLRDWYKYILEKSVTKTSTDDQGAAILTPSRIEILLPHINHPRS